MTFNKRLLEEAKKLEKLWGIPVLQDTRDEYVRSHTAILLESHRLMANCQECGEPATYSRRNPHFEYFCSEHAPEDATCFKVDRSNFWLRKAHEELLD